MQITKAWLKPHQPCTNGYQWFLENFKDASGADFLTVHRALLKDKRSSDANWLCEKVFSELKGAEKTKLQVAAWGADKTEIAKTVQELIANATTGDWAHSATTGDWAHSATTGFRAHSATTGNEAHSATTGDWAHSATTGNEAHSATTGDWAIAAGLGRLSKVSAGEKGAIVCAYFNDDGHLVHIKASKVGENGIKPNVWYMLNAQGEFVECEE